MLRKLLAGQPMSEPFSQLLAGTESSDAVAVYQLDDNVFLIVTTHFPIPMVGNPGAFGGVNGARAISDLSMQWTACRRQA